MVRIGVRGVVHGLWRARPVESARPIGHVWPDWRRLRVGPTQAWPRPEGRPVSHLVQAGPKLEGNLVEAGSRWFLTEMDAARLMPHLIGERH